MISDLQTICLSAAACCTVIDEAQLADRRHLPRVKIECRSSIKEEETAVEAKSELAPMYY